MLHFKRLTLQRSSGVKHSCKFQKKNFNQPIQQTLESEKPRIHGGVSYKQSRW